MENNVTVARLFVFGSYYSIRPDPRFTSEFTFVQGNLLFECLIDLGVLNDSKILILSLAATFHLSIVFTYYLVLYFAC